MIEISEDVKQAWKWAMHARDYLHGSANADNMLHLADFARDQLAARLEAEFRNEHFVPYSLTCVKCGFLDARKSDSWDLRHEWRELIDWTREAEKLLNGEVN